MKIHPLGTELFHADGRTDRKIDMTKLTAAFSNFANAPKNSHFPFVCNTWLVFITETHCGICELRTESLGITSIYSCNKIN